MKRYIFGCLLSSLGCVTLHADNNMFAPISWHNRSFQEFTFWHQIPQSSSSALLVFPENHLSELTLKGYLKENSTIWMILENPNGQSALVKPDDLMTEEHLFVKKMVENAFYYVDQNGEVQIKKF